MADEIRDKFLQLTDMVLYHENEIIFTPESQRIMDEICDYAEQTTLFMKSEGRGREALQGLTPMQIWTHMFERIANAPTSIHINASIILILPILRDKLRQETDGNL